METVQEALQFIKDNKVYGVNVTLHLHYDRDEEYDYTGMHSVDITVQVKRYDKYVKAERLVHYSYSIDLEGADEVECRAKLNTVYHILKKEYPDTVKREIIHDESFYY